MMAVLGVQMDSEIYCHILSSIPVFSSLYGYLVLCYVWRRCVTI